MRARFPSRFGEVLVGDFSAGDRPCVVLLHGFTAYKDLGIIDSLFSSFASAGRCVLRFDFSGNGESQGSFGESTFSKQADEVVDALNWLQREHGVQQAVLVGHSMGGAVALLAAADDRVQGVVSLAAPVRPQRVHDRRPERFSVGTRLSVPRVKGVDIPARDYVVSERWLADAKRVRPLQAVADKPVLAVHGASDSTVPVDESEALADAGAELAVLEADHFFSGAEQEVFSLVDGFVRAL